MADLTLKHLEEVWREMKRATPRGLVSPFANALAGMRVIEAPPPPPKIQISPDFQWITPEKRHEMNAWLAGRFGYQDDPFKSHAYMFGDSIVIRRDYARMILSGDAAV